MQNQALFSFIILHSSFCIYSAFCIHHSALDYMKLLDRYVLVTFLKNYLISFMVLVGMFVVLDMVFNFDDLVRVQSGAEATEASTWAVLANVLDYYFYKSLLMFNQLSGIIPVVAAAFTLMRLSRF